MLAPSPDGDPRPAGDGLRRDRDALAALASRARVRLGTTERTIRIGAVTIRLVAAGSRLSDALWPALVPSPSAEPSTAATSALPAAPAEVTVELWDVAEAGDPLPALSLFAADPSAPGTAVSAGSIEAWFQPVESAISLIDHERGRAWYCVRATAELPAWEAGAPLRAILRWALADHGLHLVHAAGLGHDGQDGQDGRGILLTGRGGSGKSTTTALGVAQGLATVGDDYVVVDPSARSMHALYRTAKLDPRLVDAHAAFAGVAARTVPPLEVGDALVAAQKRMLWLDELHPTCLVPTLPIDAILLPHVERDEHATHLAPAHAAAALRALAPSTLLQLPGRGRDTLAAMRELAAAVPVHDLALGHDLDGVAPALRAFLATIGPAAPLAHA